MKAVSHSFLFIFVLCLFPFCVSHVAVGKENHINQLESLDFKLTEQRDGQIVLTLSNNRIGVGVTRVTQGLSIRLHQTSANHELVKVFDVTEFGTQVSEIEVFAHADKTELVVLVEGEFDYDKHLEGNTLHVTVKKGNQQWPDKKVIEPQGKRISLNFQDIPVRNVLQLIAQHNDFNLVISDSVSGHLSLRLDDVSWYKALETILQIKGLDKRVDENVMLVAPQAELEAIDKKQLKTAQSTQLASELIPVKFAKADDIAELIHAEGGFSLLSERGSLRVDQRTNALLVRDVAQNVAAVRAMVESLDIAVKQVQIEARIVTVNEGSLDELGVRWGFNNTNGSTSIGGSIEGNHLDSAPIDDMLNVNLAANSANASTIAFQVAKLGSDMLLDLELSALQRESKAEVISSPRLMTTNKKPAYIEQGSEIPYLESSSSGATSVSFKKAVLSLKVTPHITPDNRLLLDLNVTQDRPGEVVQTGTGEAVAINTQRIGTQVLVNNGETVVLGGIFQHSVTDAIDKVPFFGDLPLLGALFRRTYQQTGKSELLIFVTPKVVIE